MSHITLKPLKEQVIVITGASSGIGLATARMAAKKRAKVVLAARSIEATQQIVDEINSRKGHAIFVECDVSKRADVENLAQQAIATFGRINTWVNNAGTSIYGRLDEVSEEDSRRLFDINFWGLYYGSLVALPHLKASGGGALINLGSEVSEAVIGYQGMYSTTKHAVKGFTDALRVEVEQIDKAPVSITLIQPTATDTPFPQHAKNYMDQEPKLPEPLDNPDDVAKAILKAAVKPMRTKKVGALSKVNTTVAKLLPGVGEKMSAVQAHRQQLDQPPRQPEGTLDRSGEEAGLAGQIRGTDGRDN